MSKDKTSFSELVKGTLEFISKIPGGTKELIIRSGKSSATIYNWKNSKTLPSESDQLRFIEIATSVAKEMGQSQRVLSEKKERIYSEYASVFK